MLCLLGFLGACSFALTSHSMDHALDNEGKGQPLSLQQWHENLKTIPVHDALYPVAQALVTHVANQEYIDLENVSVQNTGAALLSQLCLRNTHALNLENTNITSTHFLGSAFLPNLRYLNLSGNSFGDEGVATLVEISCPLEELLLNNCNISNKSLALILKKSAWDRLHSLWVGSNNFDDDVLSALVHHSLKNLKECYIGNNGFTFQGIQGLLQAWDPRLSSYSLEVLSFRDSSLLSPEETHDLNLLIPHKGLRLLF